MNLELILRFAIADFKLKNEGSYLGIFWYLLNPILMFLLLFLIFFDRLGQGIQNYQLYLFLGIIMFNFFQKTTLESTRAIWNNNTLIKSINFPKETLIQSIILRNLFSHFFEIILFGIFLTIKGVSPLNIIFYPIILLSLTVFTYGVCLLLSSITTHIIDLEKIWIFFSSLIWFGTPIFYSIAGQTRLLKANLLNPLYYFITSAREFIIYSNLPPNWMLLGLILFPLLTLTIGSIIFSKLKNKFAELI